MDLKVLATNLKFFRETYGYTQDELGKKLNIQRQSYCNYENARREPNIDFLLKIADFYHISLDTLFLPQEKLSSEEHKQSVSQLINDYLAFPEETQKEVLNFISYHKSKHSQTE